VVPRAGLDAIYILKPISPSLCKKYVVVVTKHFLTEEHILSQ